LILAHVVRVLLQHCIIPWWFRKGCCVSEETHWWHLLS